MSPDLQFLAETARATEWLVYATWALVLVGIGTAVATVCFMRRQLQESKAAT